jgi:hypothetical protein
MTDIQTPARCRQQEGSNFELQKQPGGCVDRDGRRLGENAGFRQARVVGPVNMASNFISPIKAYCVGPAHCDGGARQRQKYIGTKVWRALRELGGGGCEERGFRIPHFFCNDGTDFHCTTCFFTTPRHVFPFPAGSLFSSSPAKKDGPPDRAGCILLLLTLWCAPGPRLLGTSDATPGLVSGLSRLQAVISSRFILITLPHY